MPSDVPSIPCPAHNANPPKERCLDCQEATIQALVDATVIKPFSETAHISERATGLACRLMTMTGDTPGRRRTLSLALTPEEHIGAAVFYGSVVGTVFDAFDRVIDYLTEPQRNQLLAAFHTAADAIEFNHITEGVEIS